MEQKSVSGIIRDMKRPNYLKYREKLIEKGVVEKINGRIVE